MNFYGKITQYFIKNEKLSFLILLGIILWGGLSFFLIPKQYNPDIVAPAFAINVDFPGATVDEVYQLVTKPLENVLNEIPGVDNIYSKSFHGGRAAVIVEFFVGQDLEESMIVLHQKISSRLQLAPLGISPPSIVSIDPEDLPIKTLALYSEHSEKISPINLRKIAFNLQEDLKHVKGTSLIEVIGGKPKEMQIILDPLKMQNTKTSLNEIESALRSTSLLKELGLIKSADNYYNIETQEQATTIEDIENIIVSSNFEQYLRVKDIADVIEAQAEQDCLVGYYTKDADFDNAVYLAISKQKGQNIVKISKAIDAAIANLKQTKTYLTDVNIDVVKDEGRVANEEISKLIINLLQAICIVFIVLFSFLNYRAAFVVAFSIPATLLTVLAIGNFFGYTLNRITLFALILSLGLLVDSATVVIENIVRNKKRYPAVPKEKLIPKSVSEVGAGLFLSTLTTVLAFIPMLYVTGMMGSYMGPIPFFVSAALISALVFSYTINPWLAYVVCKDDVSSGIEKKCGFVCACSKWVLSKYSKLLTVLMDRVFIRRVFLGFCVLIFLIVMALPVLKLLRFRMLPKADREQVYVYLDLDRGVSIEQSNIVAKQAIDLLKQAKTIKSIQSFIGTAPILDFNGMFRGVSERAFPNQITLKLNLIHPKNRKYATSAQLAMHFRDVLLKSFKDIPNIKIKIVEDPPGPPVRSTFYVKIKSEDVELLNIATKALEQKIKDIDEVKDIDISSMEQHDKYVLFVDKNAAARSKVDVESISKELEVIFGTKIIGIYHSNYNLEQEYVVLKLKRDLRDSIEDLDKIFITNALGNHVAISKFVNIVKQDQEDVFINDNRERTVYISGEMGKRSITYAGIDLLKILYQFKLPNRQLSLSKFSLLGAQYLIDNKKELKVELGGEWELTIEVFRDLGLAMMVAIVLIYLVLVAQFKSFIIPILILGTIPLAMIGIIPGFALLFSTLGLYFSATSMIGVIALAGIVVNNAIIFIEHTKQVAARCGSLKEALLDSGLTRMRPILLTSITTILGSLVIASDPVWSGLAWSIVFGLSLSSLLTLIVFPVLIYEFLGEKWFKNGIGD